ncbi:MAG TPA: hypothetical protein VI279_11790 [Rhodocyclaceae bacterium]
MLALAGCNLFDPISRNQAGNVARREMDDRDAQLAELAARNKELRKDVAAAIMGAPPREGAGIVGEIDVAKAVAESQDSGGKKAKASPVRLEFTDTSLKDIIVVFMQDYLKQPYSFQESYKDRKVNLYFDAAATKDDLIRLFDTLLDNYGVKLRYAGGVYLVGAADDKASPAQQPSPLGVGDAVGIFRPRFVEAKDVVALAKTVVKQADKMTALPGNVLVVNSTAVDVRAVDALLRDVDVPAFAAKQILVYVPRYLSAASLVALIDSYQVQLTGGVAGSSKQFEAKQVPESERVVIVTANKTARDLVAQFLAQTDVAGANQRRVFQYSLSTQVAADIVPNLTTLLKAVLRNPAELSVVADKASNSLFIYATPDEFVEIRKLLARMDYRPPAVQVDIIIAEVNLTTNMSYGVEWYLKKTGRWLADATAKLGVNSAAATGLTIGAVAGNNTYATLQLLGSETTFSLLSSPKIVVKNGATAKIAVGSEQPVIKSKTVNNNSSTNNTVVEPEFKKIGLELEVTPFVSQSNEVRMTIKLKDTSITGSVILGSDQYPVLANRELNTDLVADDGQTIFLGGLRRQQTSDSGDKIPGLGDLKGVGALFRDKTEQSAGQELIILATPTIMLDQQGADTVTRALLRAARREFDDPRPRNKAESELEAAAPAPAVTQ